MGPGNHPAAPSSPIFTRTTPRASHVPALSPQAPGPPSLLGPLSRGHPPIQGGGLGVHGTDAATSATLADLGGNLTLSPHRLQPILRFGVPVRERVFPFVTRSAGAPSPSRVGTISVFHRQRLAGGRKEIKPVLKEGHLAGEGKGLRNPLLWAAF